MSHRRTVTIATPARCAAIRTEMNASADIGPFTAPGATVARREEPGAGRACRDRRGAAVDTGRTVLAATGPAAETTRLPLARSRSPRRSPRRSPPESRAPPRAGLPRDLRVTRARPELPAAERADLDQASLVVDSAGRDAAIAADGQVTCVRHASAPQPAPGRDRPATSEVPGRQRHAARADDRQRQRGIVGHQNGIPSSTLPPKGSVPRGATGAGVDGGGASLKMSGAGATSTASMRTDATMRP